MVRQKLAGERECYSKLKKTSTTHMLSPINRIEIAISFKFLKNSQKSGKFSNNGH